MFIFVGMGPKSSSLKVYSEYHPTNFTVNKLVAKVLQKVQTYWSAKDCEWPIWESAVAAAAAAAAGFGC